jgi:hypothetical protein
MEEQAQADRAAAANAKEEYDARRPASTGP